MQMPKFVGKPNKMPKWKKTKLFEMGQYFESSKCELVPMQGYLPLENCYPEVVQQDEEQREPSQQGQGVDQDQREQGNREGGAQKPRQQQHQQQQRSKAPRQSSNALNHSQESVASAVPPPPTHFMNYLPILATGHPGDQPPPPWPASPLAIAEEFQYPLPGLPPPPPADGCVYMPFNGYGPPPAGALSLAGPHPFMAAAHSALSAQAAGGEPRRSLYMNGEDLPADVGTLRYFYNIGVDMHLRMASHPTSPEEIAMMPPAYHHHNNTDQQPLRSPGVDHQAGVEATPPPSPEAGSASEQPPLLEKGYAKRHSTPSKARGKRPEQLHDLKDPLAHAALLPTPTPSPSTNGTQFSFYSTPPPHHLMSPPRMLQQPQPPPPIFFHKAAGPGMPPQLTGAAAGQVRVWYLDKVHLKVLVLVLSLKILVYLTFNLGLKGKAQDKTRQTLGYLGNGIINCIER